MTGDAGIIILGYKPGPVAGTVIVLVDAPGYTQAEFVINESAKGTPDETTLLRRMLDERAALADAVKEVEF